VKLAGHKEAERKAQRREATLCMPLGRWSGQLAWPCCKLTLIVLW
jgi:hypothetical protein